MALPKFNVACVIKNKESSDLYGQAIYGKPRKTKCSVIKLIKSVKATTVRTDSSGTRGHADEQISDSKLLMSKNEKIELDDYVEVSGITLRVSSIRLRYDVHGALDHIEVDGANE